MIGRRLVAAPVAAALGTAMLGPVEARAQFGGYGGNVTANAGLADDTGHMQISAPVQPGNSGGPLLDRFGSVVGVIQSKLNALKIATVTSDLPQNVNFAIKSTVALNFLEANGISPSLDARTAPALEPEAIADRARDFSVKIECQ